VPKRGDENGGEIVSEILRWENDFHYWRFGVHGESVDREAAVFVFGCERNHNFDA
jgi:hypothetical protein